MNIGSGGTDGTASVGSEAVPGKALLKGFICGTDASDESDRSSFKFGFETKAYASRGTVFAIRLCWVRVCHCGCIFQVDLPDSIQPAGTDRAACTGGDRVACSACGFWVRAICTRGLAYAKCVDEFARSGRLQARTLTWLGGYLTWKWKWAATEGATRLCSGCYEFVENRVAIRDGLFLENDFTASAGKPFRAKFCGPKIRGIWNRSMFGLLKNDKDTVVGEDAGLRLCDLGLTVVLCWINQQGSGATFSEQSAGCLRSRAGCICSLSPGKVFLRR